MTDDELFDIATPSPGPQGETARTIRTALESVARPEYVTDMRWQLGSDWTGDPAVRILLLLRNDVTPGKVFGEQLRPYEQALYDAVLETGSGYIPYITVRTESEQAEMDREPRCRRQCVYTLEGMTMKNLVCLLFWIA